MAEDSIRPITPREAAHTVVPRNPQVSHDGRVVFVHEEDSRKSEHAQSTLWMIDAAGTPRRFTSGAFGDTNPRWSPDGQEIAFLSNREKKDRLSLYVIPADGGEARLVCDWKGGISALAWSPDGTHIAFLGKDRKSKERRRAEKKRKDQIVRDRDFLFDRLYVIEREGGDRRLLSREGETHVADLDWLPDSSAVVALHLRTPLADEWQGPSDVVRYNLAGGSATTVIHLETGLEQPRVSPDGSALAFRAKAGRVSTTDQLWTVPLAGGEPRLITSDYTGTIDWHCWAQDGSALHFVGFEDLWGVLRSVDTASGAVTPLLDSSQERCGTYSAPLGESPRGDVLAVVKSASSLPPEVWTGTPGGTLSARTEFNRDLKDRQLATAEPISWTSDGVEIHGLLFRPLGNTPGLAPLVVHVHGGPAWLWSDRWLADWHDWAQLLAQRGYAVLLPNPRGSTGRGPAFTDANVNDLGGGEFRDMMTGVDAVLEMGFVDRNRLGIGGWSWGGYMTAWTVSQTDRFACAVMGAGLSNLASDQGQNDVPRMNDDYFDITPYEDPLAYLQRSAVHHMHQAKTPTLILHGQADERVAIPQAWEMYRGLQWAGVEVEMVTYPREQHPIKERAHQIDLLTRVIEWFDRHLMSDAPARQEVTRIGTLQ
jgi:dipeptidyl aminopeptidase/acylaminoacyl peptidase